MMIRRIILAVSVVTLAIWAVSAFAAEMIGLPGSQVRYPVTTETKVSGQPVSMTMTGAAMRKKLVFNVYAIASYVKEGEKVKTGEDIVALDAPKMLHLVMERDLEGKDMASAFQEAIRLNHAAPAFEQEIKTLGDALKSKSLKKGDQMLLIHLPGAGIECVLNGKSEVTINNPAFAKAIWEIYLGPKNLGAEIKAGLIFRL